MDSLPTAVADATSEPQGDQMVLPFEGCLESQFSFSNWSIRRVERHGRITWILMKLLVPVS